MSTTFTSMATIRDKVTGPRNLSFPLREEVGVRVKRLLSTTRLQPLPLQREFGLCRMAFLFYFTHLGTGGTGIQSGETATCLPVLTLVHLTLMSFSQKGAFLVRV